MEKRNAQTYTMPVMSAYRNYFLSVLILISAVFPGDATAAPKPHRFTIIQMNDVYEIFPIPSLVDHKIAPRGGLAYAATLIQQERKNGPILVLHAGDFLSPSLLSIKFKHKGKQMIAAMNAMGVEMATFGNHEFDFGCKALGDRMRESNFLWVSANVKLPSGMNVPSEKFVTSKVVKISGLRIGIFGLTVPQGPVSDCGPEPIRFENPFETAKQAVQDLKRQKVDLILALTHLRMEEDRELVRLLPDIDFVVGGHDHEQIVKVEGKSLITKAGSNALELGLIGVKAVRTADGWLVEKSWKPKPVDPQQLQPDPIVTAALKSYEEEVRPLSEVVGKSEVPLDVREETVREKECNFANFVTDVMRNEMHADIALINGGAFRGDRIIPPGPLTLYDLNTVLLFDNRLLTIEITGKEVIQALENGVSQVGELDGRFPQVSGLRFSFDPTRPPGERVVEASIGGTPLQPEKLYTMATTDFLLDHGTIDGYLLPRSIVRNGGDLRETILRNLNQPIRTEAEGRIIQE